jgi:acetolactate synthase-1/2/3 large subunit
VITGQGSLNRLHKESHQAMDVVAMFRPITKWNTQIKTPDTIGEIIRKAAKIALTEKPGATHIELPEDIAKLPAPEGSQPLTPTRPRRAVASSEALAQAAALLREAKLPFILSGNGAVRIRAAEALREFQETAGVYGANTFMGKGAMARDSRYNLQTVGLQSRDHISCALERADLVIAIGYDLVEYHPHLWNKGNHKRILHIDFEAAEVDEHYLPAVELTGDIADNLKLLTEKLKADKIPTREPEEYFEKLRERISADLLEHADDTSYPVKPQKILHEVRKALGDTDVLLSDVGAHKMWIARYYPAYEPNTVIIPNGFCSMGMALPGALAARFANPDPAHKVLAIAGDGGFLMNVQELETAVRYKLPLVVMIWRDDAYGLIEWKQMNSFGKSSHIKFGNPDFVKLAESFGALGLRVDQTEDLPAILQQALAHDGPVVIDCPVDYSENLKLTKHLGDISCTI